MEKDTQGHSDRVDRRDRSLSEGSSSLEQTLETSDHGWPPHGKVQTPWGLVPSPKWRWPVFQPLQRKEPALSSLVRGVVLVWQFLRILTFWDMVVENGVPSSAALWRSVNPYWATASLRQMGNESDEKSEREAGSPHWLESVVLHAKWSHCGKTR